MPRICRRDAHVALLAVALLSVPYPSLAQSDPCEGPVLLPSSIDLDSRPEAIEMADVDNDGVLEIIVIGEVDRQDGVYVFKQDDEGLYVRSDYPTSSICPTDLGVADLNGDGFVDLCVLMHCADRTDIFLNDGTGRFIRSEEHLETDRQPWDHVIEDIDDDGDMDIVVVCTQAGTANVFRGDGAGGFGPAESQQTVATPTFAELADYTMDGRPDLILLGEGGFSMMANLGDGSFAPPVVVFAPPYSIFYHCTLADVDSDGLWDIIASNVHGLWIYFRETDGRFEAVNPYRHFPRQPFVVADFNDDSHLDIFTMDRIVLESVVSTGHRMFQYRRQVMHHEGEEGMAAGDLDNDGDLDIVTIDDRGVPMNLLRNQGNAWFAPFTRQTAWADELLGPTSVAAIDLDGNPFMDILVCEQDADRITIFRERDGGGVHSGTYVHSVVEVGRRPRDVAVGDLDGDGTEDIVTANEISDDVSVLLNTLRGHPFTETRVSAGNGPVAVELGDLDRDGDLDAVVAAISSNAIHVLLNDGTGILDQASAFSTGIRPIDVKLADIDGDGILDCIAANEFHDDLSVLIGRGDGSFWNQQRFDVGDKPVSLACGDIDGDGDLDAAVATENDCSVVLMFGDGDGGFDARSTLPAGSGLGDVLLLDIDGDRDLDMAVSSFNSAGVYTFRNTGDGQFEAFSLVATFYSADGRPLALASADFDRDGLVDLVAPNAQGGSCTVMINRIVQTCTADLDGDGVLALFDFLEFQNLFDAGEPTADFDGDGELTIFDFLAFQNEFDAGCD